MLAIVTALLLAAAPAAQDTVPAARPVAPPPQNADEVVRRAREYRRQADRSVAAYRALARERTSVGFRTRLRDRLLYGSETAARVDWRRDGAAKVQVLGARRRAMDDDDEGADEIRGEAARLAFDPSDDRLRVGVFDSTTLRHPLAPGSEADYRFALGDTLTLRLPGGEPVRVIEVKVMPRRLHHSLLAGSLWLDDRNYGVVRALLRLSRPFREEARIGSSRRGRQRNISIGIGNDTAAARRRQEQGEERGRGLTLMAAEVELRFLTVEYGLVRGRWWLPTLFAVDGVATVSPLGAVPFRMERSYSQYEVATDGEPLALTPAVAGPDSGIVKTCESQRDCVCRAGVCRRVVVEMPADTTKLAHAEELPPSFADAGDQVLSGKEADELADELRRVVGSPWELQSPDWSRNPFLVRYNRVEGLSVGARVGADFGGMAADLTARVATASGEPDVELGLRRETPGGRLRLAGYRRLVAADPASRALGFGNSLNALLFGRDDGDYFRALGVELRGGPARTQAGGLEWRLFAEAQRNARARADWSVASSLGTDGFRPNIAADRADQAGASLLWRGARPIGEWGSLGLEGWMEGATGDFRYARPSLTLRGTAPLPLGLVALAEGGAGWSWGDLPEQSLWRLGGPASLRGYDASVMTGETFWRGRGEVAAQARAARLSLFSDVGWAGARDGWATSRPLLGVGVGASFLEGLVRFDVSRGVRGPTGWRLDLHVDAPF